ncbi:MAG: Rrf2 family transcriptional regulator, partial [Candidatus Eisenbacteria bacterium]|nr:Rrf2 family transcriptional regulator [Candidatus Eisenbacteria bacterium]
MNFSITRRGEYGITAALYLAGKDQTQLSQIHEIAKDCDLPEPFLAQILRLLVRGSLVDSRKGVNGGFRLARKAEDISFLEVLEALEGPVAVNRCQSHLGCEQKGFCSMEGVW